VENARSASTEVAATIVENKGKTSVNNAAYLGLSRNQNPFVRVVVGIVMHCASTSYNLPFP